MNAKVTIDGTGRVVIPKKMRDALRLSPGDALTIESDGDGVTLRPERTQSVMRKERGIWVFRTGRSISAAETDEALAASREARSRALYGSDE